MKIYYKAEDGQFVGAGAIDKVKAGKSEIKSKEFKNWAEFQKENSNKDIYVIDGELVSKEYLIDLEEYKTNKLKRASARYSSLIYNKYPLYKQINIVGRINGYTDDNFVEMNTYITDLLVQCRALEASIKSCNTVEELTNIDIDF